MFTGGTQLRDPIDSELTQLRLTVCRLYVDAVAESGRDPASKHHRYSKA